MLLGSGLVLGLPPSYCSTVYAARLRSCREFPSPAARFPGSYLSGNVVVVNRGSPSSNP
jgi:hypothetical protein